ncbi:MAG: hypothetical protein HY429_02875 [Candidatus Levybacteria bacterium]|nr:hypothetical protein [Candidatus Levybacteria bacterium]
MAIPVTKTAVETAFNYLKEVSPNFGDFSNFRLEEVTVSKSGDFSITLSYDTKGEFTFDRKREYKDFKVDKTGKTVLSMKIRKI